jgi:hypothetical protein
VSRAAALRRAWVGPPARPRAGPSVGPPWPASRVPRDERAPARRRAAPRPGGPVPRARVDWWGVNLPAPDEVRLVAAEPAPPADVRQQVVPPRPGEVPAREAAREQRAPWAPPVPPAGAAASARTTTRPWRAGTSRLPTSGSTTTGQARRPSTERVRGDWWQPPRPRRNGPVVDCSRVILRFRAPRPFDFGRLLVLFEGTRCKFQQG